MPWRTGNDAQAADEWRVPEVDDAYAGLDHRRILRVQRR